MKKLQISKKHDDYENFISHEIKGLAITTGDEDYTDATRQR